MARPAPGTSTALLTEIRGQALRTEVREVASIPAVLRRAMFALYARYYDCTDPKQFADDLDDKDQVVLMWDATGELRGFTSLAVVRVTVPDAAAVRAIFSGDTIVDHRYWGQQALAFTWIRLAGRIAAADTDEPLYWFLIVKGHRTYRYLQAFTRRYYPHWREPTPAREQDLLHRLARMRFGRYYEHHHGLVHFPSSRGHLKLRWAAVDRDERRRPEVAFFLDRNPGYVNGDELVCLTELARENLRPLARRLFDQGMSV